MESTRAREVSHAHHQRSTLIGGRAVAALVLATVPIIVGGSPGSAAVVTSAAGAVTSSTGVYGDGRDGSPPLSEGQIFYTDADRTNLAADVSAGSASLSVPPGADLSGFGSGDVVLVIQVSGSDAGTLEFGQVAGVSTGDVALADPLTHGYGASGGAAAEVLRVPEYANLTVPSGAVVTAHTWDGATGGVTAFRVAGTLDLETGAVVSAVALGFPGGEGGHRVDGNSDPKRSGYQGTGRFGAGTRSTDANDSGGGGGGADLVSGDGGGGGGGGSSRTAGADGTIDPIHPHQDYGRGATTIYGSADFSTALFGGGGGGGASDDTADAYGGAGGTGGGVILVAAAEVVGGGTFDATAGAGGNGTGGGQGAGGGGGGAGGASMVTARSFTGPVMVAAGGAGGSPNSQSGHGGVGGDGWVAQAYDGSKSDQTIDFGTIPDHTFGDPDFTVSATASSGLAVTFSAAGSCVMSGASTVHISGAGSCTVTASQAGDADYNPATDVPQSFAIAKVVTQTKLSVKPKTVHSGGSVTLRARVTPVTAGQPTPTGHVDFYVGGSPIGSVTLGATGIATLQYTAAIPPGTYRIQAVYVNDDGNFGGSMSKQVKLTVT